MGVGLQLVFTIMAFLFAGYWLDAWFGTAPWLMLAGVLLGFVAGFGWLFRRLAGPSPGARNRKKGS